MTLTRRTLALSTLGMALTPAVGFAQAGPDMFTLGQPNAPVRLMEFASMTCPHCAEFHDANWAQLKAAYIDTGRVQYSMHEMATPPAPVSFAMFQLARAGNAEAGEYFRRVAILFSRQRAILGTGTMGGVRDALIAAGAEWGLSNEQVMAAISDEAAAQRMQRSITAALNRGVTQTPYFLINDGAVEAAFMAPGGMSRVLDAAIARAR